MAMIDYGSLLVRNGKLMNLGEMFMEKTDRGCDIPEPFNGEFFVYAGDEDFMLCFYKSRVAVLINGKLAGDVWIGSCDGYCCRVESKIIYTKLPYEKRLGIFGSGIDVTFECIDHEGFVTDLGTFTYSGKYKVSWAYKGDNYICYTGYGIDPQQSVYDRIKDNSYGYTETEIAELDRVFKEG